MSAEILRCDRCGAAAKKKLVLHGDAVLWFCGHHYAEHEAAIATLLDCEVVG
jgi:hypothetical protein